LRRAQPAFSTSATRAALFNWLFAKRHGGRFIPPPIGPMKTEARLNGLTA
jgi:hypothetical protein